MLLTRDAKRRASLAAEWELRLYVAGQTSRSVRAFRNLRHVGEEHRGDQIIAIPTLVRKLPEPVRNIIGDLSNTEKVPVGLDLRPKHPLASTASGGGS